MWLLTVSVMPVVFVEGIEGRVNKHICCTPVLPPAGFRFRVKTFKKQTQIH